MLARFWYQPNFMGKIKYQKIGKLLYYFKKNLSHDWLDNECIISHVLADHMRWQVALAFWAILAIRAWELWFFPAFELLMRVQTTFVLVLFTTSSTEVKPFTTCWQHLVLVFLPISRENISFVELLCSCCCFLVLFHSNYICEGH